MQCVSFGMNAFVVHLYTVTTALNAGRPDVEILE